MDDDLLSRFRSSAPNREIDLRLDAEGRFWHEGIPIENPKLIEALHKWIGRNESDGRYVVDNGFDWVYLHVDDVPYFVKSVTIDDDGTIQMLLSDGTREVMSADGVRMGDDGAVYVRVKSGKFEAKFTRHAQIGLEPALVEVGDGDVGIQLGKFGTWTPRRVRR